MQTTFHNTSLSAIASLATADRPQRGEQSEYLGDSLGICVLRQFTGVLSFSDEEAE